MKLKYYLLKRFAILIKLLLFWFTMEGQIYTWGDINTTTCNHSVASIIEGKSNDLIILGKCTDKDFKNLKIGFCRITTNGKVLSDQILKEKLSFYDINTILYQPDSMICIYGTAILANGVMAKYNNIVNPKNGSISDFTSYCTIPEIFGDAKSINKSNIITLIGRKNLPTGNFNMHSWRTNLGLSTSTNKKITIDSKFNEEPKSIFVLPDTSFYVLGRRDLDQNRTKSYGMIYYITPDFKIKWNMQVLNSAGLTNQCMTCGKDGWIYYFASMKDDENKTCSSKGFIFENNGNKLRQMEIDSIYINSVLTLKNGNILATGYKMQKNGYNTTKNAHYIIYDRTLKKIKSRTLGTSDIPETELPSIQNTQTVSSEYTTAIQLSNGKIILGGSALMSINIAPDKIVTSAWAYKYLIAILTPEGYL